LRKAYADALVGGAREAGGARRNGESASLFARAIRVAPERRQELLREYADQVLYSGRPKDAIPLYQEVLQRTDLEPMELRNAQIGLGRAYFWSGEPDQALPYFTAILRVMPLDFEARIARGQALNAVATHRAALADFEFALQQRPGDADGLRGAARAETSLGLHRLAIARVAPLIAAGERDIRTIQIVADARRAMGRPDLSEDAAREILAIKPDDETARRLLDDLLFERRPLTVAEGSYITRSDNLKIGSAQVSQEFTFDRGLTKFTPTFRFTDHRGPGFPTVGLYSIGATTKRRFNDWLELNSNLFVNFEDEPAKEDVQVTHETTVSLIPTDVWRLNFTTARRYPDENPRVIVNDIFQNDFGGSFDYTPSYDFRFTGRGIYSTYSDGNERIWGQAEFAARLGIKPDVIVGARFTAFDFKRVFDNGYWNPDAYQSLEGTLHTYGPLVERLNYDIQVAGGYAWSQPGEGGPVFNVTGRLTYDVDRAVSLSAYTNYLVSFARSASTDNGIPQTGNDDPFERLTVGGQLRVRW
jgi:tetratricopeptide (TPR) repeat protein